MARPFAHVLPALPGAPVPDADTQARWTTARAISAKYARLLLHLAKSMPTRPAGADVALEALRLNVDHLTCPLGANLQSVCFHWTELAERAQSRLSHDYPEAPTAYPLGCVVVVRDDPDRYRYRVTGYDVDNGRAVLVCAKCAPPHWSQIRGESGRKMFFIDQVEVLHG